MEPRQLANSNIDTPPSDQNDSLAGPHGSSEALAPETLEEADTDGPPANAEAADHRDREPPPSESGQESEDLASRIATAAPPFTNPEDAEAAEIIRDHFDAEFYLQCYADVAASGLDPLFHYIVYGWREGRDPSPEFSTWYYLSNNEDIRDGGINPFAHFCSHGRYEGRQGKPGYIPQADTEASAANPAEVEATQPFFDAEFYLEQNPDIKEGGIDPLEHYLVHGWKEARDPNPHFSTEYYLRTNPDIRGAGVNPFVHYCQSGRHEKREGLPYYVRIASAHHPLVSVIVPNYNHAEFLPERFRSIFAQTYPNIELIVLDDCSKDNSIDVINAAIADAPCPVRTCFNEKNAGNVFAQWQRGVEMATGDLIWICESDDTCEPDFLEKVVPHFIDRSVMLSFGNIQFCKSTGEPMDGMDGYRERSEPGIWESVVKRPAYAWFNNAFGVNNVVANVGGCVFRKIPIDQSIWDEAKTYKIAGDWFLYSYLIAGGKMVYEPGAKTYFRQHERNTSASNFNKMYYYEELWRLLNHHIALWGISTETRARFIENVAAQYRHFKMEDEHGAFEDVFDVRAALERQRSQQHIVLAFLGFHSGGGEVFPINLANALASRGHFVSMLAFNMAEINPDMIGNLDRRVPIFHFGDVHMQGRNAFLESIGASVIHSHVVHCDVNLLRGYGGGVPVPYVVTLHGSHDTIGPEGQSMLFEFLKSVSHWVYTADKNLKMFAGIPLDPAAITKVRNAMPRDMDPFPQTRAELGIDDDAVVFTLVARGIQQKGWRAAVTAFRRLQAERPDIKAHLILIGNGDKADEATAQLRADENISNLGFQSRINGVYRITDCAIVPTRFDGESFPLCIIQALQEATPVIATDIGEIKTMIGDGSIQAGILLENKRDSEEFFGDLFHAMVEMADANKRRIWAENAAVLGRSFDMDAMVDIYEGIYEEAAERHYTLHQNAMIGTGAA